MGNTYGADEIGLFLSSYSAYINNGIPENRLILKAFTDSYKNYAERKYSQLITSPKFKKLKSDETILMGGDALHLSSTYREENVSSWLKWILEAPILPLKERNLLLKDILLGLAQTDEQRGHIGTSFISEMSQKIVFEIEKKTRSGRRLDIWIDAGEVLVVIETKLWDRSFGKNLEYLQDIKKMRPKKKHVCLLLLPKAALDEALKNGGDESFQAFPPVTWEVLAQTLRKRISSFTDIGVGKLYWKVLVTAFLSFIEANVLGYDLDKMRNVLREELPPDINYISQLLAYMEYREYREDLWTTIRSNI